MSKVPKPDTWMPLYVADYLVDTPHLSTEQHGAYLLLLMACWKRGGSLPNDDVQLALISRLSAARWEKHRHVLLAFFQSDEDGALTHRRVAAELERARSLSTSRSEAGAKGAQSRWRQDGGENDSGWSKPKAKLTARPMANASQVDGPSPSPKHKGSVPIGTDAPSASPLDPEQARFEEIAGIEDPAKRGWGALTFVLMRRGRQTEAKARGLVGRWVRDARLTGDDMWELARAAWENGTQDPVAYVAKAAVEVVARREAAQRSASAASSLAILDPGPRQQRVWMQDWIEGGAPQWKRHVRGPYPGEPGCRVSPEIQAEFTNGRALA